jgi:hypothetical protein
LDRRFEAPAVIHPILPTIQHASTFFGFGIERKVEGWTGWWEESIMRAEGDRFQLFNKASVELQPSTVRLWHERGICSFISSPKQAIN